MGVAIHKVNLDFFYKDSKELWYFLGFVAADGYVSDCVLIIAINSRDRHLLETFTKWIQPTKPILYREDTDSVRFCIHNRQICAHIKKIYSMSEDNHRKTEQLRFPKVPKQYIKDFILGYADGDGCITKATGQKVLKSLNVKRYYHGVEFKILGNEQFITKLRDEINILFPNNTKAIRKKKGEKVYLVQYNFKTAVGILNILYKDKHTYLYRKYDKFINLQNTTHEDVVYSPK